MRLSEKVFHKAVTVAELSDKYMLTTTVLGVALSVPSCMGPSPLPPTRG